MAKVDYSTGTWAQLSITQLGALLRKGEIQPFEFGAAVMHKRQAKRGKRK